jgi:hypothetical protein
MMGCWATRQRRTCLCRRWQVGRMRMAASIVAGSSGLWLAQCCSRRMWLG